MVSQKQVWKVVNGVVSDKTFEPVRLIDDKEITNGRVEGTYYHGDVIRSDKDLRVHNRGTRRFERLNPEDYKEGAQEKIAAATNDRDDLETMTIADLKNFAEELDMDISGVNKKQDLVEAIRKATSASAQ